MNMNINNIQDEKMILDAGVPNESTTQLPIISDQGKSYNMDKYLVLLF